MRMTYLAVFLALNVLTGCVTLRLPEAELLDTHRITAFIKENDAKRQRVSGRYKARATGLKRFFGSVDLTIAAQQPSSFYLSLPSFFGNAARVVTSDGHRNYVLDMSEHGPIYKVEQNNAKSFEKWIGFKILPREFVFALLGIVDLKDAAIVGATLDRRKGIYTVRFRYSDGRECFADFDGRYDDLVSIRLNKDDKHVYTVEYSDFRDTKVGRFAWQTQVIVKSEDNTAQLLLNGDDLNFDDEPFPIDTFQIEKP